MQSWIAVHNQMKEGSRVETVVAVRILVAFSQNNEINFFENILRKVSSSRVVSSEKANICRAILSGGGKCDVHDNLGGAPFSSSNYRRGSFRVSLGNVFTAWTLEALTGGFARNSRLADLKDISGHLGNVYNR